MAKRRATAGGSQRAVDSAAPGPKPVYDDWDFAPRAEKEYDQFSKVVQGRFVELIERLLNGQTRSGAGDVKNVGDGIYELRVRVGNNQYRILYFVCRQVCVGLTCFYKNQEKLPRQDLSRAQERRKAYLRSNGP